MSLRKDLRDGLMAAIKARGLVADTAVLKWKGSPEEFNPSRIFPSIQVGGLEGFPSVVFGKNLEHGAATKPRQFRFCVYVSTKDTDSVDADDAAGDIREDLEENLPGTEIIVGSKKYYLYLVPGEIGAERLLRRYLDESLHVQQYFVDDLESH